MTAPEARRARIAELEAERDRLREALEPFAKFAEAHDGPHGLQPDLGEDYTWLCPSPGYPPVTTRDFRNALAALTPKPGGTDAS